MSRMEVNESPKTRATIRVPEHLLDRFDEEVVGDDSNRSKEVRRLMEQAVNEPDETDGLEPPQDDEALARAYQALRSASAGRSMRLDHALSVAAQATGVPKDAANQRLIRPLETRSYIRTLSNLYETRVVVR